MNILHGKKILIIAPHQDDETIGCGGLIGYALKHASTVEVVHVFSGSTGIAEKKNGEVTSSIRQQEAQRAAQTAGFTLLPNLGFIDRSRPSEYAVQTALINTIRTVKPDVLLLPHVNESDVEHALVGRIGKEAAWLASANIETDTPSFQPAPVIEAVLYYNVWTPLESPRLYLDITKYSNIKRRTLACYTSQMEQTAWEEGSLGMNRYWGTKLQGQGYLEVFDCNPITIGGEE